MQDQRADLEWNDERVPVSVQFDDPYFSLDNGLAETRHVFLDGNDFPSRFAPGFHVAELGFGTGLNFLAAWQAWEAAGMTDPLRFTSFEAFPMTVDEMAQALEAFPDIRVWAGRLLAQWRPEGGLFDLGSARLEVITGDARITLPGWNGRADAWFLDGFSPAKNPELWEATLLSAVGRKTAPGGTVATYTAAGFVRRALDAAGFEVTRQTGFGRKRHMTTGHLR